ncbi:MAG: type II toxin-antitoxin system RelE/ParE family toxin [Alphaproteobacteria bacterium]|nr:type II toxin-antitoxin system RelE/ParE family toxin [Alphaproteobacteria bacterium]
MVWRITLHPSVNDDLLELGRTLAANIIKVIEQRIENGEPDKSGKPLHGILAGYRRLRTGDMRIVYRVDKGKIEILIIAVGMRRDDEIYEKAGKRLR